MYTSLLILNRFDCRLNVVVCWQRRFTSRQTEAWNRKQIAQGLTNTTPVLINNNSWTLAAMLDGWMDGGGCGGGGGCGDSNAFWDLFQVSYQQKKLKSLAFGAAKCPCWRSSVFCH
jgi:hypothetical protein